MSLARPGGAAEAPRCRNCGCALSGKFCAHCGQPADVHIPTTQEVIHEAIEGVTHSDSRLWITLRLLWFSPGRLTQEFVAGRRAAYLPPFRLYLVLSVLFFLVASLSHSVGEAIDIRTPEGATSPEVVCNDLRVPWTDSPRLQSRLQTVCPRIVQDRGQTLLRVALGTMPKAMFIFLPLIAFLHMGLYWKPRHRYAQHLLFFIHLHAFLFSVMTASLALADAAAGWPMLAGATGLLIPLLLWTGPLYTLLAMKRVFGQSWTSTLFKGAALVLVYLIVLALTIGTVFVYATLQL